MVKRYFKRLFIKNREFVLGQVLAVRGLMALLMKNRNTGEKWTKQEIREIKVHLKDISKMVPVIIVFLLPGGTLMLPLLAEVLDRRKAIRRPPPQTGGVNPGTNPNEKDPRSSHRG